MLPFARRDNWPQEFCNLMNSLGNEFIVENNGGFGLYRSFDGTNWVRVTNDGMGNPWNMGLRTMASTPHGLFLGTANPFGPRIWSFDEGRYVDNSRGGCEIFLGAFSPHAGQGSR